MGIKFCTTWSCWNSRRPKTKAVPNSTQPTHDLPVTPPVASARQSYHLDTIAPVGQQRREDLITQLPHLAPSPNPSLEPASVSIEAISSLQSLSPPQPAPPLLQQGENHPYITLPEFPGFVEDNIYRDWPKENLCGMHAYRTVGYAFGKELITDEKYGKKVPGQAASIKELVDFADEDGLGTRVYHTAQFSGSSIRDIDDAKAFIIMMLEDDSQSLFHAVAMVRSKEGFRVSSGRPSQDRYEIYPATATEAFLEYQRRRNLTAYAVLTFYDTHGLKFNAKNCYSNGLKLYRSDHWKEAIKACDEVITHLWVEKEGSVAIRSVDSSNQRNPYESGRTFSHLFSDVAGLFGKRRQ